MKVWPCTIGGAAPPASLILFLLWSAMLSSPAHGQPLVTGYHAWWMQDAWRDYDLALYDKIYFFEFAVDSDGRITDTHGWPQQWSPMIEAVHAVGGRVVPTFAILDPAVFSSVLGRAESRERLANSILDLVRAGGADGAHLNFEIFEASTAEARDGYGELVERLRRELRDWKPGADLTLFLPGFDHGEAYDEVRLAAAADFLVVQGYDMHWLNGPTAGPVAPLRGWDGASWRDITGRYARLGIPAEKLVMSVPYFGYEWPTDSSHPGAATLDTGVPITYAPVSTDLLPLIRISAATRVSTYGELRDPLSGSPYYAFERDGRWYQGWFEDRISLKEKYRFVREYGLGGVAVFLLGYDGGRLEPVLREEFGR